MGLNLVQFLFLISWYNGNMIQSILQFISHLLFIYISYHLLITTVDWARWLKVTGDNQPKINMLILFIAIALGYLVSTFFLELLLIGRSFATMS
ncbi:putative membrane protein [Streptococcus parasuis]|nr:putative membrane protein [Streptococcus parasuis]GIC30889.1 putative membrane protein [Streptococcus parasuis]